jgi:hypothetical protein
MCSFITTKIDHLRVELSETMRDCQILCCWKDRIAEDLVLPSVTEVRMSILGSMVVTCDSVRAKYQLDTIKKDKMLKHSQNGIYIGRLYQQKS